MEIERDVLIWILVLSIRTNDTSFILVKKKRRNDAFLLVKIKKNKNIYIRNYFRWIFKIITLKDVDLSDEYNLWNLVDVMSLMSTGNCSCCTFFYVFDKKTKKRREKTFPLKFFFVSFYLFDYPLNMYICIIDRY